jgi:transcriptional regulator with XRE-family HTH domain
MRPETLPVSAAVIRTVRKLRKDRGLTAAQLAGLMCDVGYSISRTALAQAESGQRKEVSIDWVWAVSSALNVPIKNIIYGPDCTKCSDAPPPGYSCNACGKAAV